MFSLFISSCVCFKNKVEFMVWTHTLANNVTMWRPMHQYYTILYIWVAINNKYSQRTDMAWHCGKNLMRCSDENYPLTWFLSSVIKVWGHRVFSVKAFYQTTAVLHSILSYMLCTKKTGNWNWNMFILLPSSFTYNNLLNHVMVEWWWKKTGSSLFALGKWAIERVGQQHSSECCWPISRE